jgi:putative membrane protein
VLFAAEDFFRWQPHPEIWVLLVGLAGLYTYALRSIGPRAVPAGQPVATAAQKRWFAFGIALVWIAADWPMHDIGEQYLYSVHMFQHMMLAFFIPPVMLLATPDWLARLVIGDGTAGRWFLKLARPVPAAVVFNAVQLLTHWSVVVNSSVENGLLHYGLHTIVVISAFAVWMPVVSPLPELRTTIPAQCVHLFLISIVPTVPAAWLALAEGVLYDAYDQPARLWGVSVTADQQLAGLIMKLGGGMFLWFLIVVLFFRWSAKQDRGTTARRAVVADDGSITVEGPPTLTYEDVADVFERTSPPPREPAP